ncbi:MAG: putative beta-lysine N-acetyltransferase [Cyanobacteriota bacterium]
MYDEITKIGHSIIQHGKHNNRIYLIRLSEDDFPEIITKLHNLAVKHKYTKVFAKIPSYAKNTFEEHGYVVEAEIPGFYSNKANCYFMAKYFSKNRRIIENNELISDVLETSYTKDSLEEIPPLNPDYNCNLCYPRDTSKIIALNKKVFKSYPYPIFNYDYVLNSMLNNFDYYGIWNKENLLAISGVETHLSDLNAKLSGFATLPEYRGNNFSLYLIEKMEKQMLKLGIKTLYSIIIANSYSINITFSKMGYTMTGLLINNSNIGGNFETMAVWYKKI